MTVRDDLKTDLIRDEGEKLVVYDDATGKPVVPGMTLLGQPTISVGVNIGQVPLTLDESRMLFCGRLDRVMAAVDARWPWMETVPAAIKRGVYNMAYNMGTDGVAKFTDMLSALQAGDYPEAATAALQSRWAGQVGDRATRIAELFRSAATVGATS